MRANYAKPGKSILSGGDWLLKESLRLSFRKGDWLAIAAVLLAAAALTLGFGLHAAAAENIMVEVRLDGVLVYSQPLTQNGVYTVEGDYTNTVTVQDGRVAVTASDCPGSDCVHSGWAGEAGRAIICLPNRMEIRLTGSSDVDIIVG